jgi:hypothetical protein
VIFARVTISLIPGFDLWSFTSILALAQRKKQHIHYQKTNAA